MADANLVTLPQISGVIPQDFIIEALGGAGQTRALLDRFPDAFYHKAPETHLFRFLYVLLGPVGVGQLSNNYLQARLDLEALGLNLFDLDSFFGDPLSFGRILDETFDVNPADLQPSDPRAQIAAQDAAYRNRALDFIAGARLGNTPAGMALVAQGGLGHEVAIIENYQYLYDQHSDDPLGYTYYGRTLSTEEFIVLPMPNVSRSEVQVVTITGIPSAGYFALQYNHQFTDNLPYNAPAVSAVSVSGGVYTITTLGVQEALEAVTRGWSVHETGTGQSIEANWGVYVPNIIVSGGPGPASPYTVQFTGTLGMQDIPALIAFNGLTGGDSPQIRVSTNQGGLDASQEIISTPAMAMHDLQEALDRIRPVTSIPTVADGSGTLQRQDWQSVFAASSYTQVIRYVTGNPSVTWPAPTGIFWIEPNIEKEAPRAANDISHHYQGFHNIGSVSAYTEAALADINYANDSSIVVNYKSEHIGRFGPEQQAVYPPLRDNTDSGLLFTADRGLADYAEQPVVTGYDFGDSVPLILGVYPAPYASLPGVPGVKYKEDQFWSSLERTSGDEYLEIDLGQAQVVNYLAFETLRKPIDISIAFDLLDQGARRNYIDVTQEPNLDWPSRLTYAADAGWAFLEFNFADVTGESLYTRYLRLKFSRRVDTNRAFLFDPIRQVQAPWSIEVRNLRVGRNVSNG